MNCFRTIGRLAVTLAGLLAVLSVAACSPGTATSGQAASPAASPVRLSITSTLDGHARLPQMISWVANPSVPPWEVAEVDFLIDGKVTWIESQAPYVFGGDDNGASGLLFTTWLAPGMHAFTVRVIDTAGHKSADTVTARVPVAPQPPAALKGIWTRIMSGQDIANAGLTGADLPPTGRWKIVFNHVGAWELDPLGGGLASGIAVRGHIIHVYAPIQMAPWVNNQTTTSAFGHHDLGGTDCTPAGPFGTYRWSVSGSHLTLTPVDEGCPDRQAVWAGVWSWAGRTP